jgi:hypothetical protein
LLIAPVAVVAGQATVMRLGNEETGVDRVEDAVL